MAHVRVGSFASFCPSNADFGSTSVNGHLQCRSACLKGANSGLTYRRNDQHYSIISSARGHDMRWHHKACKPRSAPKRTCLSCGRPSIATAFRRKKFSATRSRSRDMMRRASRPATNWIKGKDYSLRRQLKPIPKPCSGRSAPPV